MTPGQTHLAQSTVRAAAWELAWGVGVGSAFSPEEAQAGAPGDARSGQGDCNPAAALLVEWALSPYLTNSWLLRKLSPDVVITQVRNTGSTALRLSCHFASCVPLSRACCHSEEFPPSPESEALNLDCCYAPNSQHQLGRQPPWLVPQIPVA